MHILGKLLQILCESLELKPFLFKQRNQNGQRIITLPQPTHVSGTYTFTYIQYIRLNQVMCTYIFPIGPLLSMLYYASGYGHSQLLLLICELYGGVPKAYEVFRCCPTTTYEELSRFMERVKHYSFEYLVMQPNKLPNKLKEVSYKVCFYVLTTSLVLCIVDVTELVERTYIFINYSFYRDYSICSTRVVMDYL